MRLSRLAPSLVLGAGLGALPLLLGADGCGGTYGSTDAAPNVSGAWDVTYARTLDVDVEIGGSHYTATVPETGGMVHVEHGGSGFDFEIDCARPELICPSEVWPDRVTIDQRDATYRHRMWVTIPTQTCSVPLSAPDPSTCGAGTPNPDCDPVCDGEVTTSSSEAFGLIRDGGRHFDLFLGAGAASNGVNCVLLGVSAAEADLDNVGSAAGNDWESVGMSDGVVRTGYAGGCLWAGDPAMSGETQALVLGASLTLSVPFTASKVR
jgi:hypothetical protein